MNQEFADHMDKDTAGLSRREREKNTHQKEILVAARELFLQKGYHHTTLEEIAQHAQFGKGTIYNYFNSKEELFYGIVDELIAETTRIVESSMASPGDARTKLTLYAKKYLSYARDNFDLFQLIIREMNNSSSAEFNKRLLSFSASFKKIIKLVAQPLKKEMKTKTSKEADPLMLAMLFDGMLRFYCLNHFGPFRLKKDYDIDHAVALIVSVFFDGILELNAKG